MAAFQQALANLNNSQPPQASSSSSASIRGAASGAPSGRGLASALRGAGISREQQMELDGSTGGRPNRGAGRRGTRSAGPLDQTGRHHPPANAKPYAKPGSGPSLASRMAPVNGCPTPRGRDPRNNVRPGRNPAGTPPTIHQLNAPNKQVQEQARSELGKKLHSQEMKDWVKSKMIAEGVVDMSGLQSDPWLKTNGILPPGHPDAPTNAGMVFWRLIDEVLQKGANVTIHTLSLANNNFAHLKSLDRLPTFLPNIRALDISNNPIKSVAELDNLLAVGEKKGKANAGAGSLKSLIELKMNDCQFREKMLSQGDGEAIYKHEILRRFPSLRILDGVNLDRVVFPIERKPKVRLTDEQKSALSAKPFTYPCDVQPGFFSEDAVKDFAMAFCAKYFPLFDGARNELVVGYAPNALISISANTLSSRSKMQLGVQKTRMNRPQPVPFEAWTSLPSRNFFRGTTSIKQRMETLHTPTDPERLLKWWNKAVPKTKHPLTDASKWCFESWVLDGEGVHAKLCLMIQGQFEEMPSGTYRSFSRTFVLVDAPAGSLARNAGWPAIILSDTMIVHSYLGTGAFDESERSLIIPGASGISIQPPSNTPTVTQGILPDLGTEAAQQEGLINQVRQRTNMNSQFATMCLAQNGWNFEAALKNFEEIKGSIPAEAFQ